MRRRAFTLMELMVAVLLGTMIMLMIAGGLQSAIRSWERVQERVAVNYNRRSVLDLIKRQTSSIFYRDDANAIDQAMPGRGRIPRRERANAQSRLKDASGNPIGTPRNLPTPSSGFQLPDGASFFYGNVQELSFISSVSFLSDFPGQVAVRYYVVQGDPGDGEIGAMPSSRTPYSEDMDEGPMEFGFDEELPAEELEGDLYLVLEEQNLFLASTMEEDSNDPFVTNGEDGMVTTSTEEFNDRAQADANAAMGNDITVAEVQSTRTMKVLGPLRRLVIRYRRPGVTQVEDAVEDDRWAQTWDINRSGNYPSAIEISIAYEPEGVEPEEASEVALEELDNVRMMVPVYDTNNLMRGANNGAFGGNRVMGQPSIPGGRGDRNRGGNNDDE